MKYTQYNPWELKTNLKNNTQLINTYHTQEQDKKGEKKENIREALNAGIRRQILTWKMLV